MSFKKEEQSSAAVISLYVLISVSVMESGNLYENIVENCLKGDYSLTGTPLSGFSL